MLAFSSFAQPEVRGRPDSEQGFPSPRGKPLLSAAIGGLGFVDGTCLGAALSEGWFVPLSVEEESLLHVCENLDFCGNSANSRNCHQ